MLGYIKDYDGEALTVIVPFSGGELLRRQGITECEVDLCDGRQLSPEQRNKIFALVADIADYAAGIRYDPKTRKSWRDETLRSLQLDYILDICDREEVRRKLTENYCRLSGIDLFSLAARSPDTIDMTTARDFIDWLVELCVVHGVPCQDTLLNRCEDQQRYLYACVMNRRCCICGKKADIHEYDRVGRGRNRRKIHHSGQRVQPLCRQHHQEVDNIGQKTFDEKYRVSWVRLDDAACEKLGWRI